MKVFIYGSRALVNEIYDLCIAEGHDAVAAFCDGAADFSFSAAEEREIENADVIIDGMFVLLKKKRLLKIISALAKPEALIQSLALTVAPSESASWIRAPVQLVGYSLLPSLDDNSLVEIAPSLQTGAQVLSRSAAFWEGISLKPIIVKEGVGLIRARILCSLVNEAAGVRLEGTATVADIDLAMKLGTNYPMGPLEWGDFIGLDLVLAVMEGLYNEWGEDRYRPSPLLRRMVQSGRLGKKSLRGFYSYDDNLI